VIGMPYFREGIGTVKWLSIGLIMVAVIDVNLGGVKH